jgi:hypothetical protein
MSEKTRERLNGKPEAYRTVRRQSRNDPRRMFYLVLIRAESEIS